MGHPYVCTTCRLHVLLRKHSQIVYRQRQWLSQTTRKAQDPIERAFAHKKPLSSSSPQTWKNAPLQDDQPLGRYSGRPLAPQELLHQLDDSSAAFRGPYQPRPAGGYGSQRYGTEAESQTPSERPKRKDGTDSERPPSIPPRLWQDYQRFCYATKPRDKADLNDHKVVQILLRIARMHRGTEGLRSLSQLAIFRRRTFFWVRRLCDEWAKDYVAGKPIAQRTPRPVEAITAISACSTDDHGIYPAALWSVAAAVAELQPGESEAYAERLWDGTRELMELWNLCMRIKLSRYTTVPPDLPLSMDWSFLPDQAMFAETLQRKRRVGGGSRFSFERALSILVPEVRILSAAQARPYASDGSPMREYPSPALVTLDLLRQMKAESGGGEATKEFEPWMRLIDMVFKSTGDNRIPFALAQKLDASEMREYYKAMVRRLGLRHPVDKAADEPRRNFEAGEDAAVAQDVDADPPIEGILQEPPSVPPAMQEPSFDTSSPTYRFVGTCIKRLGRAVEQEDLTAAQRVQVDVQNSKIQNPELQLPMELYESLLYSFLSLRNPQLTVSIWNEMIRSGHQPRSKTYTIMMRGSQNARDHNALEGFWKKMRESGLKPDGYAWTTRIFGLLRSRTHVDVGLKAMGEMGQEWVAAARAAFAKETPSKGKKKEKEAASIQPSELLARFEGDVDDVPRPDVVVMNSAISALAAREDSLIPKVLSWGRSFGIEPDLTTYNALINISMRRGMPGEALNILRRMNEKGVEANSSTWTVLLTAMFEGGLMDDLGPEEVEERILSFVRSIDDMDGNGLDEKGYALIIDRLLKTYNNPSGAQRVLERMAATGMKPNTHLYTILMSSYFQQSPPNFAAVENLWNRIQSENAGYGAVLDSTFYDRMIEGYAQHHRSVGTKPMLSFLERMEAQGKRPSWRALEVAARALVEAGEWARLERIVEKARREEASLPGEEKPFGRRDFWNFVKSTGLSRHKRSGIPKEVVEP